MSPMQPKVSTAGADDDLIRRVEELKHELDEAHRREASTAEVLKAISRSNFNLQDVLDSLVKSAVQLTAPIPNSSTSQSRAPRLQGASRPRVGQCLSAGSSTSTMCLTIPSIRGLADMSRLGFAPFSPCQCSE